MECSPRKAASGIPARAASAARHGRGYRPKRPSLKRRQPWRRPMPTPDPPATLAAALAELQTQLPHIAKDSKADIPNRPPHSYAGLGNLSHELLPIMGKLGLSFSCKPTVRKGQFGMRYKLRLTGTSEGDKGFWPLPGGAPQATGSALTYYRRYILQCLTGAVADDDDDGAAAAHMDTPKPQRTRTKI